MRAWVVGCVLGCAAPALATEQVQQRPPEVFQSTPPPAMTLPSTVAPAVRAPAAPKPAPAVRAPAPGQSAAPASPAPASATQAAPAAAVPALAGEQTQQRPAEVVQPRQPEAAPAAAAPKQEEIVIDSGQREREWSTGVEKPPPGPGRTAFDAQAISVDAILNEVKRNGQPLPASEFYRLTGRPDLVKWSEDRSRQRTWLIASGTVIALAGVVTGVFVMGTGPDTSSAQCQSTHFEDYTACLDRASKAQMTGAFILGASLAVGGVLFVWGMNIPEMVTPAEQTLKMATEYNQTLSVKNGGSPPSSKVQFRLVPSVAPGYAGLTARLTF